MWNVAAGKPFTLQKLTQFRILSITTLSGRLPKLTQCSTQNLIVNKYNLQTLHQRAIAGRSSSSSTPPSRSRDSIYSQTNTSFQYSGSRTGRTSSCDPSGSSLHSLSMSSKNLKGKNSGTTSLFVDASSLEYVGSSSRATTRESHDSKSGHGSITESYSDDSSGDSGYSSRPHPYRRSRWDNFYDGRNSYAEFESAESPKARVKIARTVSVEHRGNPSLLNYEKEFTELKRDKSPCKEWNKRFPEGTIVVYTDGSCIDNRASGFGVYFGPDHELNRSERIIGPIHNSGLAEILGAQTALRSLRNWRGYKNESVILRTDFLPLVQAMNESVNDGRFGNEIEEVRSLAESFPRGVQFEHVYAHDGDPGNEQADTLARIATADARRACSASASRWRYVPGAGGRERSRSRNLRFRSRNRSRSASWDRNRARSRHNNRDHIRSHSAFVAGRRR